jgi:hypothetical protein
MQRPSLLTPVAVIVIVLAVVSMALSQVQSGPETAQPEIVVFYEENCPDCVRMEGSIEELLAEHPDTAVARYEIGAPGALDLLGDLSAEYGIEATNVPIIFVGEDVIVGAGRAEEMRLRTAIGKCLAAGCPSPLTRMDTLHIPWADLGWIAVFLSVFLVFFFLQGG